jgi:hypothetical protein
MRTFCTIAEHIIVDTMARKCGGIGMQGAAADAATMIASGMSSMGSGSGGSSLR